MAKVVGPLLSMDASGSIAGTQVYAKWRGVPYVRQKVTPANPKTADQTKTRSVFTWLAAIWKLLDPASQAPWTASAKGQPYTNRNAFMGRNVKLLRGGTDITAMILSPGANGGLAAATATAAGGAGEITGTMVPPTLPSGWATTNARMVAINSQDPHSDTKYTSFAAVDAATPFAPSITGLAAGTYEVFMWFEYTKPDASIAYGPSTSTTATAT